MPTEMPTLHMVCGKIASGKSTLIAALAQQPRTILISEDVWLGALFADQMSSPADYVRAAARLREAMAPHVAALLRAGVSVALDFPANTVDTRRWLRDLLEQTQASHALHVLDVPDDVCLERLRARNAEGTHPFKVTDEQFRRISRHYVPPTPEEGFSVVMHKAPDKG